MDSKVMGTLDFHANSILAAAYSHPSEVMADHSLSAPQKRCVLAAWASDAFAVEGNPWHRQLPGRAELVPVSEIFAALRRLDAEDDGPPPRGGAAMRARQLVDIEFASASGF